MGCHMGCPHQTKTLNLGKRTGRCGAEGQSNALSTWKSCDALLTRTNARSSSDGQGWQGGRQTTWSMISHPHADLDASRDVTIVTVTRAGPRPSQFAGESGIDFPPSRPKVRYAGCVGDRARSQVQGQANKSVSQSVLSGRAWQGRADRARQGGNCDEARDGHLRLGRGLDWVERGSRDGGFEAVGPFLGDRAGGTRGTSRRARSPQRAGRRGEPTVLCLRLAGCGTWPIWGHFHEPSARWARTARTASKGGFSIWGSTPQPRLTRWGTVVTAAWEHGDLASCQSPSCDERTCAKGRATVCCPKGLASGDGACPKRQPDYCPLWMPAVCNTAPSGRASFPPHGRPVSEKKGARPSNSARLGASQTIRSPFLPTFWASEEYQKWRQEKRQQDISCITAQHSASCPRCLSHGSLPYQPAEVKLMSAGFDLYVDA